ncbi:MAG: dihydroorotate dehydrogenase-like protein [Chloroflexi bacterium]|nr:dihydroorotate dehydrogenase-like protein [Chloroflexota bacterium]
MDLTTTYMGLTLKNPIVPSSSPISHTVEGIKRAEDAGAAAIVMYSLFEEQITMEEIQLDHGLSYFTEAFAEALDFFPDMGAYNIGPDSYFELIRRAKEATDIPIIGSLNGITDSGWTTYARNIEQAGADALELNVYYIPTSPQMTGREVEQLYLDILTEIRATVAIPVAMKLNPFFSAPVYTANQMAEAGADALVLFNRFYQPDLDVEELHVVPQLTLSHPYELHLPLRWVAIMYGRVQADLAITTGVHNAIDVLKCMMAGAKVSMMASELLRSGVGTIRRILDDLLLWMEEREYESIQQMQGSLSQQHAANPDKFERAIYRKVLSSWSDDPAGQNFQFG